MPKIRNKKTGKIYEPTAEQWEAMKKNKNGLARRFAVVGAKTTPGIKTGTDTGHKATERTNLTPK